MVATALSMAVLAMVDLVAEEDSADVVDLDTVALVMAHPLVTHHAWDPLLSSSTTRSQAGRLFNVALTPGN